MAGGFLSRENDLPSREIHGYLPIKRWKEEKALLCCMNERDRLRSN
jgi:hypothetical protein